ncbi:MAG: HD domain-containing protein [Acholeplasmatales bacterium]|nr:HD domain-containing protein [Acholeplasmatales bacterium]
MRKKLIFFISIILSCIFISSINIFASPFLSDKNEEEVYMEVPGARAICQTDDGYIWIGQYSSLTRYDSKELVSFKEFTENDVKYEILNVRKLAQKNNELYILTYKNLFKYADGKFSFIVNIDEQFTNHDDEEFRLEFLDLCFDKVDDVIYLASNNGLFIYNIKDKSIGLVEKTANKIIRNVAYDVRRDKYYYQVNAEGVYDQDGNLIYSHSSINELFVTYDTLYIGLVGKKKEGKNTLIQYDLANNKIADSQYDYIMDQVNIVYYSSSNNMLFVGCDSDGIYCINLETNDYSQTSDLVNATQIVDIIVDYQGNLWLTSNNNSSSGVSVITKNSFYKLLYGDKIWDNVFTKLNMSKVIYAVEKYNNILYLCLGKSGLVLYDLENNKIISSSSTENSNPIMDAVGIVDFRDVEVFNNKVYFADYGLGLVEYDPASENVEIYDLAYLSNASNIESKVDDTGAYQDSQLVNIRCLRAFDGFLVVGYQSGGVYKFDGSKISIYHTSKSTMYISTNSNGDVIFNHTGGIFKVANDFKSIEEIETNKDVEGNRLKFLYDGNKLYYNLNSRLFCSENGESKEIVLPYIKGSIVEIAKVKAKDALGNESYKYLVATTNQVFVTDSFDDSNLDSENKLINYEVYDSTNGLKSIQSNTSGFYDSDTYKYYIQTTDGVLIYDFSEVREIDVPTKIAVNSVVLDGISYYGNEISVDKNTYRIEFNLSILGFKPNKGYKIFYKLDGIDNDYVEMSDGTNTISFTNVAGGEHVFHVYVEDSLGQKSNQVNITLNKAKKAHETVWFWIIIIILALVLIGAINFLIIWRRSIQAKKRETELKEITIESIEAIARTIDAKDTYTNGHSIRVGHFSRVIAQELGMEGEELENLYYIALLHDIGKIGIPDAILNKPGRLTDEEFDIMKSHTTKGAKILKDISTIPNIVEGAKYHHEKYGGGGYPEGLKGEDIPYIARIICCADCFDAMATRRVYKDPYPKEKIISEFERCKEIQFDPKIADVVIKLIEEGKLKAE